MSEEYDESDFRALPADFQLLHLNIQEKVAEKLRELGPIARTPEGIQAIVDAILAGQNQTVEDCGGIRVSADPSTRVVTAWVPRIAGLFSPEE